MTPQQRARIFVGFERKPDGYRPDWARFDRTPEQWQADWEAECRNARLHLPPWAYHRDWLNGYALLHLPAVCRHLGTGPAIARAHRPSFWPVEEPGRVLVLLATPQTKAFPLYIDEHSGYWEEPGRQLKGLDLIELAERRLGLSAAKAAWRLARICGRRSPMP